jgi:isopenicillin N synthase-like dioxygenase
MTPASAPALPIVDIGTDLDGCGRAIDRACREVGFFLVTGHGVDPQLLPELIALSHEFFALPDSEKAQIAMPNGGRAWRGWFPLGGELTSGIPDGKEGIYFGSELAADHPRVIAGTPLHGANLFPARPARLGPVVLEVMRALETVGRRVLEAMASGLGLEHTWFATHLTSDPTVLFRIFRYPPDSDADADPDRDADRDADSDADAGHGDRWGVREHTDYGLVTVLAHDGTPGLQVHTPYGWVDAPPRTDAFVINVGDMLEKLTAGRYRSTPHRVRNASDHDRLSFPLFLDPSWDARVVSLPLDERRCPPAPARRRWDAASPLAWDGSYGDYLTSKVARVFPHLTS